MYNLSYLCRSETSLRLIPPPPPTTLIKSVSQWNALVLILRDRYLPISSWPSMSTRNTHLRHRVGTCPQLLDINYAIAFLNKRSFIYLIFSLCGAQCFIGQHSDRSTSFLSQNVRRFLIEQGVATTPTGNPSSYITRPVTVSQVERYNGIIWRTVQLALANGMGKCDFCSLVLYEIAFINCYEYNSPFKRYFRLHSQIFNGHLHIPS